jgi:hypothetical protein
MNKESHDKSIYTRIFMVRKETRSPLFMNVIPKRKALIREIFVSALPTDSNNIKAN